MIKLPDFIYRHDHGWMLHHDDTIYALHDSSKVRYAEDSGGYFWLPAGTYDASEYIEGEFACDVLVTLPVEAYQSRMFSA